MSIRDRNGLSWPGEDAERREHIIDLVLLVALTAILVAGLIVWGPW